MHKISDNDTLAARFAAAKILVAGDVMLDRYWFGDTHRISPEAPVPVARIERTENRAGGAANVARNIASLGGKTLLLSVTGDDEAGAELARLTDQDHIRAHFIRDASISTTIKLRVIARNQQLIRLDFENRPSTAVLQQVMEKFREQVAQCDAVVLSDYGKGGLMQVVQMIDLARQAGKPVLIDPKGSDYLRYRGATMITPNRAELREVIGAWENEDDLREKVAELRANLRLDSVLLTRSEEGMTLFSENTVAHRPTVAREVFDVSGAGDTVIGVMALCLAAGLDSAQSMQIANICAGVVVGKVGTAVCTLEELLARSPLDNDAA